MPKPNRIFYTNPRQEGDQSTCPWIWRMARRILHWVGRNRLPGFLQKALAVAEPAGKIFMRDYLDRSPKQECGSLTILSANLWHDWPRFYRLEERLEAFTKMIETHHVDVVIVQELSRTPTLKADVWLADRLKMAYVYTRANGSEKIGFEEGLGIYSRFPIHKLPFLRQVSRGCIPFVRRMVLGAAIDTPCGETLFFSVHLGLLRRHNVRQLHDLQHWIAQLAEGRTAFIGGDFNAIESSRQIRIISSHWLDTYRQIYQKSHPVTHEIRLPWGGPLIRHRLDYIFMLPGNPNWRVLDVHHILAPEEKHSDHHAVLARFEPVLGSS